MQNSHLNLSRVDLADLHDPRMIAKAIHAQLERIESPVPIMQIARSLGISDIRQESFDGFEGMLLTDRVRSSGAILANTSRGARRARFTVAHELGHFLMERHQLSGSSGFTCQAQDMRATLEGKRNMRQESEANQFAINLLAPYSLFDQLLSQDPSLKDAQRLRDTLNISLEAAVRRMVERREECLAVVWSKDGQIRYWIRGDGFPWITGQRGERLPQLSMASKIVANGSIGISPFVETSPMAWTSRSDLELFEQTRLGNSGHAVTLLWAELSDEDDGDDSGLNELSMPQFR